MKKAFLIIFFICSGVIFSDDHGNAARNGHEMHTFVHLNVTNPAAVVAAIDKFASSDCGKKFPGDIGLMSEMINGSSASSHFVIASYPKLEDYDEGLALVATCAEAPQLLRDIAATGTQPIKNLGFVPVLEMNNWTQDSAFIKYDLKLNLSDEVSYAEAWSNLMASNPAFEKRSYGLNRVVFGNDDATHFVYLGGGNVAELMNSVSSYSQNELARFTRREEGIREIVNTSLIIPVKAWPGK